MLSITDTIKGSVLEGFDAGNLSTLGILVPLMIALLLGSLVYLIYRVTSKSGFYNRGFNKTLVAMPVITTAIMLAMQSNLLISLGMVGALSIVRFRNAVKDPADLMFLFWSISVGIIVGARLYELAMYLSFVMALLVIGFDLLPSWRTPCLLVISAGHDVQEEAIVACLKESCRHYKVRSRNITHRNTEWIFEMQAKGEAELVRKVSKLDGVISVNLLSHDGEVRF